MAKLKQDSYLVLTPTAREYRENERGVRPVTKFRIDRMVKNRPTTKQGELAVKVNITIDSSLFDKVAPVVNVEFEEGDVFANVETQVAINAEPDEGE